MSKKRKRSAPQLQEFSQYDKINLGKQGLSASTLVGHLVNCDKPIQNVEVFFSCKTNNVKYQPKIRNVFELMKKQKICFQRRFY